MRAMHVEHYGGTASLAGDRVESRRGLIQRINIRNIDGANALEVSFDLGHRYYRIPINSFPLDFTAMVHEVWVRGVVGTAAWVAVTNEG